MAKVGEKLPSSKHSVLLKKRVALFGLCGNYIDTEQHLPGILDNLEEIKSKGADVVAVIGAAPEKEVAKWVDAAGGKGKLTVLGDDKGAVAEKLGLSTTADKATVWMRTAMFLEEGVVKFLKSDKPSEFGNTSAFAMIEGIGAAHGLI